MIEVLCTRHLYFLFDSGRVWRGYPLGLSCVSLLKANSICTLEKSDNRRRVKCSKWTVVTEGIYTSISCVRRWVFLSDSMESLTFKSETFEVRCGKIRWLELSCETFESSEEVSPHVPHVVITSLSKVWWPVKNNKWFWRQKWDAMVIKRGHQNDPFPCQKSMISIEMMDC